jgi:hypothetical protein
VLLTLKDESYDVISLFDLEVKTRRAIGTAYRRAIKNFYASHKIFYIFYISYKK